MNVGRTLEAELRALEEELFRADVGASSERLNDLLAEDFVEFGSSGRIFDKKQITEALRNSKPIEISLSHFESIMLSDKIALVRYRATRRPSQGAHAVETLRSSIWRYSNGEWQMVFHQGTLAK